MLWTRDSDLELFVTLTDINGEFIDVESNWISIEIKVGRALFKADSNPLAPIDGEEELTGAFENCYLTMHDGVMGIMVVVPANTLDFGTVYMRSCMHVPDEHFQDQYKDVWNVWMPINLAVVTEKGLNQ